VQAVEEDHLILDYGCGTGQVSLAFPNVHFYDIAEFSRDLIRKRGRIVYEEAAAIPQGTFDFVLSSHALEHSPQPYVDLQNFGRFVKAGGRLLLILPVERDFRRTLNVDSNNHLYGWTFQTIGNLLHAAGWEPLIQTYLYDSFGLGALSKLMPGSQAVNLAWRLGRVRQSFKSMMIVARHGKAPSAAR